MNKKFVLANWGIENQGKSDTIKRVTKLIIDNYKISKVSPQNIDYSSDIKVIIEIKSLKIGIESQGDPNSRLIESLKEFEKAKCDVIICSTRSSGGTVDAVNSLSGKSNYNIIWITNYRSNEIDHNILNDLSSKYILELFSNVIDNKL